MKRSVIRMSYLNQWSASQFLAQEDVFLHITSGYIQFHIHSTFNLEENDFHILYMLVLSVLHITNSEFKFSLFHLLLLWDHSTTLKRDNGKKEIAVHMFLGLNCWIRKKSIQKLNPSNNRIQIYHLTQLWNVYLRWQLVDGFWGYF